MQLTAEQRAEYEERGFLVFPDHFSEKEIQIARDDLDRVAKVEDEAIIREKSGALRTVFRMHDEESATHSAPFHAMARLPRLLGPAKSVLGSDDLYVHHSKLNLKEAIDGAIWQWHQDFGYWRIDGVQKPEMTTFLVMLNAASEMSGCLYFLPGSHKKGRVDPVLDETSTSYKLWKIPTPRMIELMEELGDPVPIVGGPGTAVLFHPNILHGSGHNMSRYHRWHMYFVYNRMDNKAQAVDNPRPEYVCSRLFKRLDEVDDNALAALQQPAMQGA